MPMSPARYDVLVVGAGITGIYQLYRARAAGFTVQLLEAGDGVGGTWFWNRYPGARFDSESYTYGYLFSRDLFNDWEWREHFAEQPEIERYLNHVVDRFGLREHIRCGARVTAARFDEVSGAWQVTTDDDTSYDATYLVSATGVLSVPFVPEVPGRDEFDGRQLHTGRWPATPVDLAGQQVAIIGTGSSGVQLVPIVAEQAASLTVYQRTANWCTPLNNSPITAAEQAQLRADFDAIVETLNTSPSGFLHPLHDRAAFDDSEDQRHAFYEQMWKLPGFGKLISHYTDLTFNAEANADWCEFVAGKIRSLVADRAIADKLIPRDHRFGEKRPPFVTGYFEAFNRPNVSLVDLGETPMLRMTRSGIETADGVQEFDIVVWATGFDFGTGALSRIDLRGREGLSLAHHWADGPQTYLGIQTAGFPNFFLPGGPHAAAGNNPRYNGDQVDFVTDLMIHAREHDCDTVEIDPDAEARWTAMIDRAARKAPSFGECSYYFGTNIPGKPRKYLLNSAGRPKLLSMIAEIKQSDFAPFRFAAAGKRPLAAAE